MVGGVCVLPSKRHPLSFAIVWAWLQDGLISLVACRLIAQGHSKGDWARYSGSEQRRRSCFGG